MRIVAGRGEAGRGAEKNVELNKYQLKKRKKEIPLNCWPNSIANYIVSV